MSVTIVLADGFDGEDVELSVDGHTQVLAGARTSPLTGMADELVVPAGDGPVHVIASTASGRVAFDVPVGATLVLDRRADGLEGRVHTGPVGFA